MQNTVSARKTCSIPLCTQGANTFAGDWENTTRKLWGRDKPSPRNGNVQMFFAKVGLSYPIRSCTKNPKLPGFHWATEPFGSNSPIGVLCLLGPILRWPVRGGVTLVKDWMTSPSFGKVKWNRAPKRHRAPELVISRVYFSSNIKSTGSLCSGNMENPNTGAVQNPPE